MWPVQEEEACLALRGCDFDLKRVCPKRVEVAGKRHALTIVGLQGLDGEGANGLAVELDGKLAGGWSGGAPVDKGVEDGFGVALTIEGEVGAGARGTRCRECGDL